MSVCVDKQGRILYLCDGRRCLMSVEAEQEEAKNWRKVLTLGPPLVYCPHCTATLFGSPAGGAPVIFPTEKGMIIHTTPETEAEKLRILAKIPWPKPDPGAVFVSSITVPPPLPDQTLAPGPEWATWTLQRAYDETRQGMYSLSDNVFLGAAGTIANLTVGFYTPQGTTLATFTVPREAASQIYMKTLVESARPVLQAWGISL